MKTKNPYIRKSFRMLLIHMYENKTTNIELTLCFGNIEAKFNVKLIDLERLKEKGE